MQSQPQQKPGEELHPQGNTQLMYFSAQEFSPRYGDQFFTQRLLPLPCRDGSDSDSDSDAEGRAGEGGGQSAPLVGAHGSDSSPPGTTNMLAWVFHTLARSLGLGSSSSSSSSGEGVCCDATARPEHTYTIEVRRGSATWTVQKQFPDFVQLLRDLQQAVPQAVPHVGRREQSAESGEQSSAFSSFALLPPADSACPGFSLFAACTGDSSSSNSSSSEDLHIRQRHQRLGTFLDEVLRELSQRGLLDVNSVVRRFCALDKADRDKEAAAAAPSAVVASVSTTAGVENV